MKPSYVLLLSVSLVASSALAAEKPNLIAIMCDDLGYADVGFNGGQQVATPGIDRVAREGIKFTDAYATYSVCGPSRAGFMTGRYQGRFGFSRNPLYKTNDPNTGLPKGEQTMGEALQRVGHHRGIIGKWHLGAHISNHPLNRGFDELFGHLGGGHKYFQSDYTKKDSYSAKNEWESYHTWIMRNHDPVEISKYLTDEFSDEAVDFVKRNHEKPFFCFFPTTLHTSHCRRRRRISNASPFWRANPRGDRNESRRVCSARVRRCALDHDAGIQRLRGQRRSLDRLEPVGQGNRFVPAVGLDGDGDRVVDHLFAVGRLGLIHADVQLDRVGTA